ncbi:hypothetical protein BDV95DRAFT_36535 [Massariosphaeria phaeospora]|uniref:Uncharacterized protein n=1 Tax=Massariosphaeria phaeospora TaxID=100035 RepID=A0A7C8M6N3_9PLEO|nr:hypothetical protein BDV95DRAFT_36535 [Massariosphaeria phaeospora]
MAQNENEENPELARILHTLANLPPNPVPHGPGTGFPVPHSAYYAPPGTPDPRLVERTALEHRQASPKPQKKIGTLMINPTTITEWKQGLRCVSKLAAVNQNFVATVQKMIKDHERNVKDWDVGRKRLIEEQTAKRENEETHRAALSFPGFLQGTAPLRTPEREKEELDQYDQKVYRASKQMADSQSSQLKSLGVPFFGVRPDLMLPEGSEPASTGGTESGKLASLKKITKEELLELQRKMLNHLMELYGD